MTAVTTFRDLLAWLDARGELARVRRAVDPTHELIAVMRKMQKGPNDALLFENVGNSAARVATNVFGRRETLAASLGLDAATLVAELVAREGRKLPLDEVGTAPCQEIVHTQNIDVAKLIPQIVHSERDAGAYVTAGIFLARHPDTGVHNASFNRAQIAGGDKLRARMMPPQHLGQYQAAAERRNAGLPTAVIIGAPPSVMLSAASKIPFEADELEVAGAWQNQKLRVVKAKTQPLLVPADAEFVLEGEILPHVREEEGPFGEFTDGYVEVGRNHVFRITAITHRRDPIWHVILAGGKEDLTLLGVPLATEVHKRVAPLAKITAIGTPGQILGCVVAIDKTSDAQAKEVLNAAMAAHAWMKIVVVVDADVDVHDPEEVLWAIHTRATPDTGIVQLRNVGSFQRADVAAVHKGKLGIDATVPMAMREVFARRHFPGMAELKLEDYTGKR